MVNNFQRDPIFLDVSESDNSISWCLQGQQMWKQIIVFDFDCFTIYGNPALLWNKLFCTFPWSLDYLGVVQPWCSFPFRLCVGYVWPHCNPFVTFNMRIMFTWIKRRSYRFALLFKCVFSTKLASSFFIFI